MHSMNRGQMPSIDETLVGLFSWTGTHTKNEQPHYFEAQIISCHSLLAGKTVAGDLIKILDTHTHMVGG